MAGYAKVEYQETYAEESPMDFSTLLAVRDLMSKEIVTASESVSVVALATMMAEQNISSVVVITDGAGEIIGIVTEADIVRKGVATGLNLAATTAKTIMNGDMPKIDGGLSIFEARDAMKKAAVKHMIVEEGGKTVGIISSTALLGS